MALSWSFVFTCYTWSSFVTPPLSLNYRHVIEYLLYIKHCNIQHRTHLSRLWHDTFNLKWGPFFRLRSSAKHLGFCFEDPFVFIVNDVAYSVDGDLPTIKHIIRNSYQAILSCESFPCVDRIVWDVLIWLTLLIHALIISLCVILYTKLLFRYILTGSVDHASRLYKSKLLSSPLCMYCNNCEETAKHIFWDCTRWNFYS